VQLLLDAQRKWVDGRIACSTLHKLAKEKGEKKRRHRRCRKKREIRCRDETGSSPKRLLVEDGILLVLAGDVYLEGSLLSRRARLGRR
jgi:hypothetical protein